MAEPQTTAAKARTERKEIANRKRDLCNELHRIDARMVDLEVFLKVADELEKQPGARQLPCG